MKNLPKVLLYVPFTHKEPYKARVIVAIDYNMVALMDGCPRLLER